MISAEDNQVISPWASVFASRVEPGMVVNMSIVLRQETTFQEKCPRCDHKQRLDRVESVIHFLCVLIADIGYCSRRCPGQF
jgi:hypothetical protein